MSLWGRLGNVIKSYLNDDDEKVFWRSSPGERSERSNTDPDFNAAYEELDDFLNGRDTKKQSQAEGNGGETGKKPGPVSEEIRRDFAELGLNAEATPEECKEAYKKLLKIHHPDRHAGHPDNMKKATEKSARLNVAYDRIVKWFRENS